MNNIVSFQKKHDYFNNLYYDTHPYADKESRVYHKPKEDCSFKFVADQLVYNRSREVEMSPRAMESFKTFTRNDMDLNQKSPQKKISFYLSNNLVPVDCFNIGFQF
jgi:hypothetical protein